MNNAQKRIYLFFLLIAAIFGIYYLSSLFRKDNINRNISSSKKSIQPVFLDRNETIMSVPPERMYETFLTQYAIRPDMRFINSFSMICDLYWKNSENASKKNPYYVGELKYSDSDVYIPIMKNNKNIKNIELSLPTKFDHVLSALNKCLDVLKKHDNGTKSASFESEFNVDSMLNRSLSNFTNMDPRWITLGLMRLQDMWNDNKNPKILIVAARGYGMLLFNYYLDSLQKGDPFCSKGLSLLAFAKWLDPSVSTFREEVLFSMYMDYKNHASELLKSKQEDNLDITDKMLDAYLREDLRALKNLNRIKPGEFIGCYLLSRLYSDMGLYELAEQATRELLQKFPLVFLSAIQSIYYLDLNETKILTNLYPMSILAFVEGEVNEENLTGVETWRERMKAFYGNETQVDVSLSQFDSLLSKWTPMGTDAYSKGGIIVNEELIKEMYKGLYAEAVFFRYDLLMNKWGNTSLARKFLNTFLQNDNNQPVLFKMQINMKSQTANFRELDEICSSIINNSNAAGVTASIAHYNLSDTLKKIKFGPQVVQKLDGRPFHISHIGLVLQRLDNYDMAEKFYNLGLSLNKFYFRYYEHLSQVTKEYDPIFTAVERFPNSFKVMVAAGDYLNKLDKIDLKTRALEYYKKASEIVPEQMILARKIAKALQDLERYEDANEVLEEWVEKHGSNDLSTTIYKGIISNNFLLMNNPEKALEILTSKGMDQYQAGIMMNSAKAYEALGDLDKVEAVFKKAIKRYPEVMFIKEYKASFLWRHNRDEEAAQVINEGRKLEKQFSKWYFDSFMEIFSDESEERIMNFVNYLMLNGAPPWEIGSLGFLFQYDRPDIAFKLIKMMSASGAMPNLEKQVSLYKVYKKWKGQKEALEYLRKKVPSNMRGMLAMVLFKEGLFNEILEELDDIDKVCPRNLSEFCWLQKLMSWLVLGKKPDNLRNKFNSHYNGNSSDYYFSIGKFMLSKITEKKLLSLIRTQKQRCEFSYYLGFSERAKGNFKKATNWYHICRQTLLRNNGEFHWASNEMFWWAHMGTNNRHKLMIDDVDEYHKKAKENLRPNL